MLTLLLKTDVGNMLCNTKRGEQNEYRNHSAGDPAADALGCNPHVAAQPIMGIRAKRRSGAGTDHRPDTVPAWQDITTDKRATNFRFHGVAEFTTQQFTQKDI